MKKSDIKTGMLVQTRGSYWYVVMKDAISNVFDEKSFFINMSSGNCLGFSEFSDTLQDKDGFREYDIIKVAKVWQSGDIFRAFKTGEKPEEIEGFEIIWERQKDSTEELQAITKED